MKITSVFCARPDRSSALNAGYFLSAEYLDSGNIGFGYTTTFTKFGNNADDSGNLLYLSAQKHLYLDSLPGKLSLRGATWLGQDSIKVNGSSTTPSGPVPGPSLGKSANKSIRLDSGLIAETSDIEVYYAELAFLKYDKSFYVDTGYAHSEYDGSSLTKADQLTPGIGFGWNQSYDWLQLRSYLIKLDQQLTSSNGDRFESLELKYTHWYSDGAQSNIEFVRLSGLLGERKLAVDPDTAAIYSTTDVQKANLAASIQWKFSAHTKALALIQYDRYQDANLTDYDSFIFYINFQFQQ